MKNFAHRVAVVTGAGSGLGRALALALAGRGARLALSDVDTDGLAGTVASADGLGAEVRGYELDVADRAAVLAHAEEVAAEFGRVNLVVNNAGVALGATVEEMSFEDFDWLMGINLGGVVNGTKAFLPHLIASGDGHLVNVSSVFGFIGVPSQSAYNAAKFAVRGFTEALREEMLAARHPVGVSCVHPGGIKTDIVRNARGGAGGDRESAAAGFDKIAMTTPERAARTILRGVQRRSARILIGPDAYLFDAMPRVLGSAYQRPVATLARFGRKRAGLE
ncbi:SDR family NAD(P)-dependent oxidoreductase [Amycolatopsis sp. PS_44_ISF1]|uniref:SDR family NAD(P)-dependent oxidoreductase n=1 Tax=Amycolatopsis sp. PS_44_ISF1 TaxID=2974917 RepID=UPI0028DDE44D|nr:SDR family NAD(P)-dependent oxidoreductase [Amycolatopsis sp. PS_44_ISF1]MDT8910232.1 SDR family NAD(P)-dependent oxidoreductase [Amycolatopsis sp. PS_44_ISF1]